MEDAWIESPLARREPREDHPRVRMPKWPEAVVVCLLAARAWLRWLHRDGATGRQVPCTRKPDCPYCPDRTARLAGYVAAIEGRQRTPVIAFFSAHALDDLNAIVTTHGAMRGLVVRTERADRRDCARIIATYMGTVPPDTIPEEFDPRPSLEAMWGWSRRELHAQALGGEDEPQRPRRRRGR